MIYTLDRLIGIAPSSESQKYPRLIIHIISPIFIAGALFNDITSRMEGAYMITAAFVDFYNNLPMSVQDKLQKNKSEIGVRGEKLIFEEIKSGNISLLSIEKVLSHLHEAILASLDDIGDYKLKNISLETTGSNSIDDIFTELLNLVSLAELTEEDLAKFNNAIEGLAKEVENIENTYQILNQAVALDFIESY